MSIVVGGMSGMGAPDPRPNAHSERRRRRGRINACQQWNRAVSAALTAVHTDMVSCNSMQRTALRAAAGAERFPMGIVQESAEGSGVVSFRGHRVHGLLGSGARPSRGAGRGLGAGPTSSADPRQTPQPGESRMKGDGLKFQGGANPYLDFDLAEREAWPRR